MSRSFKTNAPSVVSEVIDGEAVIMNLKSGNYFSTLGIGSKVWSWVDAGHTLNDIAAALSDEYEVAPSDAATAVEAFIGELIANELVVALNADVSPPVLSAARRGTRARFSPPVLNVYSDMQDLLLLDPIHDVDEAGWPQQKRPDEV